MKQNNLIRFMTALLSMVLILPLASHATGIPVVDAALNALTTALGQQKIVQGATQIAKMATQIENQIKQIEQLKAQVSAMTGSRNMGNLLKDKVKDEVPDEWKNIYSNTNVDYKKLLDGKNYNPDDALKQLATDNDLSIKAFNETKQRLENIKNLMNQIDQTKDIKGAADLQNRIAAEQAIIQNNQIKLDMMDRLERQQEKIQSARFATHESCEADHLADQTFDECK